MLLKTNIPETTLCLVGDLVDFGDNQSDRSILNDRTNKIQAIVTGNRCGHAPDAPRFFVRPDQHKPRPSILENAIEKLKDVYCRPKKFFRKLATFHPHDRQKRSERREAVASVAQVLLHYLELSTLRVGFYVDPTKFIPLDLHYIAKKAGLSITRAKRAIADLAKAGYINVSRQFNKKEDGTFKGLPSIREIAVQFFIDLGIDVQKLFFTREWKRKKEEKAQAKNTAKKLSGILKAVASFGGRVIPSAKRGLKPDFCTTALQTLRTQHQAIDRDLSHQALEMYRSNPERTPSDYLKEILQRLKE